MAEGTTKERLLNDLYLALQRGEREELMCDYPFQASLEERAHHFWNMYIAFDGNYLGKYKVFLLLGFSDQINEQVQHLAEEGYEEVEVMVLGASVNWCAQGSTNCIWHGPTYLTPGYDG